MVLFKIGKWKVGKPITRKGRLVLGIILILLGFVGFLPIIGFWMIPLGLFVLSEEIPVLRRLRRRIIVWYERRKRQKMTKPDDK